MKKALLLGNGLNRLNGDYSWERLIGDLLEVVDPPTRPDPANKPFPLFYEEIVQAANQVGMKESRLKFELAGLVEGIKASELHSRLPDLGVSEILITNYDYNVEAAWPEEDPKEADTSESKYSLFRRKSYSGVDIWHIHGERDHPESILLGYEHYSGYLQFMRSYMMKGHESRDLEPLFGRIKKDELTGQGYSWLDFFFNRKLFILGLTMDYVEMHLWWLITYRARLQSISEFRIENTITYIYPKFISREIKSKLQLLMGVGIHLQRIDDVEKGDWVGFYDRALTLVKDAKC